MKRLIKRPLKALWRWTHPLRRPVVRKVEALLARSIAQASLTAPHFHVTCNGRVTEETGVLMDFVVRELVRLQDQVDRLQQSVEDLAPRAAGLSVVNGLDGDETVARSAAG